MTQSKVKIKVTSPSFFYRRLISQITERISTKLGHKLLRFKGYLLPHLWGWQMTTDS